MKPNPQPMTLKRPMLETTKADMAKAPSVKEDQFSAKNGLNKESAQVDAYWSAHLPK